MPEAPGSTAKSAAEACAKIAGQRETAVAFWREKAEEGDFGQVHSPSSCYVRALDDPGPPLNRGSSPDTQKLS